MKKKLMILLLVFTIAISIFAPLSVQAATGWIKWNDNNWYYYYTDTNYYQNGWYLIDGKAYYFAGNGAMQTGWIKKTFSDGSINWYYANSRGELLSGWQKINGVWYYFDPDSFWMYDMGAPVEIDGNSYFIAENGAMQTGWIKVSAPFSPGHTFTAWYYANASGVLQSGWQKIGGIWYYFDPDYFQMFKSGSYLIENTLYVFHDSGSLASSEGWVPATSLFSPDKTWFYANADGTAVTGWKKIGGIWYYFHPESGVMVSNGVISIDGKTYLFQKNGALVSSPGWAKSSRIDGSTLWYYIDIDGTVKTGWLKLDNTWYYLDPETRGGMIDSATIIDGQLHAFSSNGKWTGVVNTPGWYKNNDRNCWYYILDKNGTLATEWQKIGGVWYYFNPEYYFMISDTIEWIDGAEYYFYANGAMATGWIKQTLVAVNGATATSWYYANSSGVLQSGWQTINGTTYYFHSNSYRMYCDGVYYIDGNYYKFSANGACLGVA